MQLSNFRIRPCPNYLKLLPHKWPGARFPPRYKGIEAFIGKK